MSLFRKTPIALLVASALASPAANAVTASTDGIGDLAIAPYYTVNNDWDTLINLTNTKPYPVVVKVRIHEYRNSRDVFDFLVALSAYDSWTSFITENDAGEVALNIVDEDTCTVPQRASLNATTISSIGQLGFSGTDDRGEDNSDGGPLADERLREGYIEFVVMGHTGTDEGGIDTTAVNLPELPFAAPATDIGNDIQTHDCAAVDTAFQRTNIVETAQQFGEPINALKFNFRLLNVAGGTEVGGAAEAWSNFWNGTAGTGAGGDFDFNVLVPDNAACTIDRGAPRRTGAVWDPAGAGVSCMNLITAQEEYDFLDPSVNDAYPAVGSLFNDHAFDTNIIVPAAVDTARVTAGPVGVRGVDALSSTIQRASVVNEWAVNPDTGTDTEWVVTFPTKYFYVDRGPARQFAIIDTALYPDRPDAEYVAPSDVVPYPPFAQPYGGIAYPSANFPGSSGQSCNEVSFARFDRAQNSVDTGGGTIPSPAPPQARTSLCYEANVITFSGASPILGSMATPPDGPVDITPLAATAGWMKLRLDVDSSADATEADPNGNGIPGGLEGWSGLPAIGFMMKQRDFNDPSLNYSSSIPHGFERYQPN